MRLDDPALPAVTHLTGDGARDVIDAAVTGIGGVLGELDVCGVQYRPHHDLVVQFRAMVQWPGRHEPRSDTLLAAVAADGALPGTLPVTARQPDAAPDGDEMVVSVWRWPFDPIVPGIEAAATPGQLSHLLGSHVGDDSTREVVAYRPTERAVVRATSSIGRSVYVKAVSPATVKALVDRHVRLIEAGLPVPEVLEVDTDLGLVVLEEKSGTTLRERIKSGQDVLIAPGELTAISETLSAVDGTGLDLLPGRISDASGHAMLLERIHPTGRELLDPLLNAFEKALVDSADRRGPTVHGDLHEGQLIVDDSGRVTGLLDVDSLSVGDPLDDVATILGHLTYRRLRPSENAGALDELISQIRSDAADRFDPETIDVGTAAVLVGLATGPFRAQVVDWDAETNRVLGAALLLIDPT